MDGGYACTRTRGAQIEEEEEEEEEEREEHTHTHTHTAESSAHATSAEDLTIPQVHKCPCQLPSAQRQREKHPHTHPSPIWDCRAARGSAPLWSGLCYPQHCSTSHASLLLSPLSSLLFSTPQLDHSISALQASHTHSTKRRHFSRTLHSSCCSE